MTSKTYRVKKGDTLYSIARKYNGVSHQDIMRANGIGTTIRPGQTLKIPR
ncbi:MAG: LysM peptidoglycan-binding domain-containing protein [Verrucomicrobiales bacterium]